MNESAIDQRFNLTDLLDLSIFREVCEAFTQSSNLGLRVIGEDGKQMIQSGVTPPFCEEVNKLTQTRRSCPETMERISTQPLNDSTALQVSLFCGLRYAVFPLYHQFDCIGRVVVGPYREGPWPSKRLLETHPQLKNQVRPLEGFADRVPQLDPDTFKNQVRFLAKVLDAFIFVNAKRLITTRLHLENIMESRQTIFQKFEEQQRASKDDPDSPDKLKGLF